MNEQTQRIVYRLPRACQSCHDGNHGHHCARTVYASPFEPLAPCECACQTPRVVITTDDPRHPSYNHEARTAAGRRGAALTLARYGREHYRTIGKRGALARLALARWDADTRGGAA